MTDELRQEIDRRTFLGFSAAAAAGSLIAGCRTAASPVAAPVAPAAQATSAAMALDRFAVTETQVRAVMARALQSGGDFCDLFFQRNDTQHLSLEDHAVNKASSRAEIGVGVRVVRGVETGYAYTESLDQRSMLQAAEVAAAVATGSRQGAPRVLRTGRLPSYYPVQQPLQAVETGAKAKLLLRLNDLVVARDKRITKVNVMYRDESSTVLVVDSAGRAYLDHQPMAVCYVSCAAEHKGQRESNYRAFAARAGLELFTEERLQQVAREAVERTVVLFEAVPGPVGELPVVLGPGSSGIVLHEAIGHGMEADFARKRTTIYAGRIGKRIAPPFVTIVDDGTNPGLRGSINVDDEGNATARTVLVEAGILRTFLHDRISARHFAVAPTGSGRRESFRHMPIPRMRNTYMAAGPHTRDEIIRSVERGIYAEHFTNGQVNIGPGDFTFYIKNGMLIEKGKLTRPIKDVNIIGNGPQVLERVQMVGDDFRLDDGGWTCGKRGQRVPVGLGMPSVKIAAVTVGGTQKS